MDKDSKTPALVFTTAYNVPPPAAKYIKPDIEEYYLLPNMTYTIPRRGGSYTGILNDEGLKLYTETLKRVKAGDFKDTVSRYQFIRSNSGYWEPNMSSPFFSKNFILLNTFKNIQVSGLTEEIYMKEKHKPSDKRHYMSTSPVIFYTSDWCLTKSGSLYKLGTNFENDEDLYDDDLYDLYANKILSHNSD